MNKAKKLIIDQKLSYINVRATISIFVIAHMSYNVNCFRRSETDIEFTIHYFVTHT